MDISVFKKNLSKYAGHYNPGELFKKLGKVARKVGEKTVYVVLVLYYATFDKGLPMKDRLMVLAALGYFILPLDILPDALPGGFADDAAALMYVVKHIWKNLSPTTIENARRKLKEWFKDASSEDIDI